MIGRLRKNDCGSAAVEMALVTPMLLILMMGAFELGNYFVSQHVLIKGLGDGAQSMPRAKTSSPITIARPERPPFSRAPSPTPRISSAAVS